MEKERAANDTAVERVKREKKGENEPGGGMNLKSQKRGKTLKKS